MKLISTIFCVTLLFASALTNKSHAKKPLLINGAGASFPYILYSKWFAEYRKVAPHIMINYRSIGSGGGIRQFLTGTLDFGATDVPIKASKIKKLKRKILHLPTALGAVALSYNLPSLKGKGLSLSAPVLADIYLGKITKWNDEQIISLNPGITLPAQNIVPVYRADGSGTTAVFTEYLSYFSPEWLKKSGKGKAVNWLVGIGGKGNEGVTGLLQKIPGAIGYVAMSYALNRRMPIMAVQNTSGHFVRPNTKTVSGSALQVLNQTKDLFHPLTKATGPNSYPLASYTYLLVDKNLPAPKGPALLKFGHWFLDQGQSFCESLHYIPLPKQVITEVKKIME